MSREANIHAAIEDWRKEWPVNFPGPRIDDMSGGMIHWVTIQNERSLARKGKIPEGSPRIIPEECFIDGRRTLVRRDPFLDWREKWMLASPRDPWPSRSRRRHEVRARPKPAVDRVKAAQ